MDPATFAGLALAFGAVIGAIFLEGSSPMSVILPAPMLLGVGGTVGAVRAGSTMRDAKRAFGALPAIFKFKHPDLDKTIDVVVDLADRARREGLLALEDEARHVEDEFLRAGLQSA